MATSVISIANDFSPTPAGRYCSDGPASGERFREEFLYPALQSNEQVEVNLDGTLGYGSSFLEEAFGGLVREKGMTPTQLQTKLRLKSGRRFYVDRVWKYITDAQSMTAHK